MAESSTRAAPRSASSSPITIARSSMKRAIIPLLIGPTSAMATRVGRNAPTAGVGGVGGDAAHADEHETVEGDDAVGERRADAEPVGEQGRRRWRGCTKVAWVMSTPRRGAGRRRGRGRSDRVRRRAARAGRARRVRRRCRGGRGSGRRSSWTSRSTSTVIVPGLRAMMLVMSVTTSSDGVLEPVGEDAGCERRAAAEDLAGHEDVRRRRAARRRSRRAARRRRGSGATRRSSRGRAGTRRAAPRSTATPLTTLATADLAPGEQPQRHEQRPRGRASLIGRAPSRCSCRGRGGRGRSAR